MKHCIIFLVSVFSSHSYGQSNALIEKISKLGDSIRVGNLVVYNVFKYQLLSHKNNQYDTAVIIDKVYKSYPELWDSCLALIFGDSGKIFRRQG